MDCAVKFVSPNLATLSNSLNSETVGIFYEFLGDGYSVKLENEILEKSRKM